MGLLIVAVVVLVVVFWVRATRRTRSLWLRHVDLPGAWHAEREGQVVTLELSGDLDGGTYLETSGAGQRSTLERGRWWLSGQTLTFDCDGQESACELRVFGKGCIGLHGPGRERLVYDRVQNNVVPLRREQP